MKAINGYSSVIKAEHPELQLIEGTHTAHISNEEFREKLVCAFEQNQNMPGIILGKI